MRYPYMLAREDEFWPDSWTYTGERQYIVRRDNEQPGCTRCAVMSHLPVYGLLLGFAIISISLVNLLLPSTNEVQFLIGLILGLLTFAGSLSLITSNYVLMKAVGPLNKPGLRVLPGEEKNDE